MYHTPPRASLGVSVIIPAYNAAETIRATLDSVLAQTRPADEILVMDDGSTDQTSEILEAYKPKIHVFRQFNGGVSAARNALFARAHGDLIAFLDADDIWHHAYLGVQTEMRKAHPEAAMSFTGHVDFAGYGDYFWTSDPTNVHTDVEVMNTLQFFTRNYKVPGPFKPSFCCLSKSAILSLSDQLAPIGCIDSAEDFYMFSLVSLLGLPVIYTPTPLVAYRNTANSLSANSSRLYGRVVDAFHLLAPLFREKANPVLLRTFHTAFASARRTYGKHQMADGRRSLAREQFRLAIRDSQQPAALAKSLAILLLTYMPGPVQPQWPDC